MRRRALPSGYAAKWMPLIDAIEHVQRVAGSATEREALRLALRDGAIKARYHGGGAFGGDGCIDPSLWNRARLLRDGSVEFAPHWSLPPTPPELRGLSHQVEVCRADLLELWPAAMHPHPAEARPGEMTLRPAPGPKGGEQSVDQLAWKIALQILQSADRPAHGHGRLTALARMVNTKLASKGHRRQDDSIRKAIRRSLREWEAANPNE
jgi:hypothetical protein